MFWEKNKNPSVKFFTLPNKTIHDGYDAQLGVNSYLNKFKYFVVFVIISFTALVIP